MRTRIILTLTLCGAALLGMSGSGAAPSTALLEPRERLPDWLRGRLVARAAQRNRLPALLVGQPRAFVFMRLSTWDQTRPVRVAFLGGSTELRTKIMEVAKEWTAFGRLQLDFGPDPAHGKFYEWTTTDQEYKAEIRVQFREDAEQNGYWSAVGTDSADPKITKAYEPSLNLGGFDDGLPVTWKRHVRHEFGHALGAQHEHQAPEGGCEEEFLWDPDPGYEDTRDDQQGGLYIPDSMKRRPGVYKVMMNSPYNWKRDQIDDNLRDLPRTHPWITGPWDPKSVMMYSLESWMFKKGTKSRCYVPLALDLSDEDKKGFRRAYPVDEELSNQIAANKAEFLAHLLELSKSTSGGAGVSPQTIKARLDRLKD